MDANSVYMTVVPAGKKTGSLTKVAQAIKAGNQDTKTHQKAESSKRTLHNFGLNGFLEQNGGTKQTPDGPIRVLTPGKKSPLIDMPMEKTPKFLSRTSESGPTINQAAPVPPVKNSHLFGANPPTIKAEGAPPTPSTAERDPVNGASKENPHNFQPFEFGVSNRTATASQAAFVAPKSTSFAPERDISWNGQLILQEEDKKKQQQEKETQQMMSSETGRATLLAAEVLKLVDAYADATNDIGLAAVGRDEMVHFTEKIMKCQSRFKTEGKPSLVAIAYHYTKEANLKDIRTRGLRSRVELKSHGVPINKEKTGAYFGEGIYTSNNPFCFQQYGNVGLICAILQGNSHHLDGPKAQRKSAPDTDTVVGNKTKKQNACFDEIVLRNSSQCLPLLRFSKHAISPTVFDTPENTLLWELHNDLQRTIDTFFNDGIISHPTRYLPPKEISIKQSNKKNDMKKDNHRTKQPAHVATPPNGQHTQSTSSRPLPFTSSTTPHGAGFGWMPTQQQQQAPCTPGFSFSLSTAHCTGFAGKSAPEQQTSSTQGFTFGAASSQHHHHQQQQHAPPNQGFSFSSATPHGAAFGCMPTNQQQPASTKGFSFGAANAQEKQQQQHAPSTQGFSFRTATPHGATFGGMSALPHQPTSTKGFSFGRASVQKQNQQQQQQAPSTQGFTFSPATPHCTAFAGMSAQKQQPTSTQGFSFGASSAQPSTIGFDFLPVQHQQAPSTHGFSFGTSSQQPNSSTSVPPPPLLSATSPSPPSGFAQPRSQQQQPVPAQGASFFAGTAAPAANGIAPLVSSQGQTANSSSTPLVATHSPCPPITSTTFDNMELMGQAPQTASSGQSCFVPFSSFNTSSVKVSTGNVNRGSSEPGTLCQPTINNQGGTRIQTSTATNQCNTKPLEEPRHGEFQTSTKKSGKGAPKKCGLCLCGSGKKYKRCCWTGERREGRSM